MEKFNVIFIDKFIFTTELREVLLNSIFNNENNNNNNNNINNKYIEKYTTGIYLMFMKPFL